MKNLIDLKNEILETNDIDKINKKLEICYNDLISHPDKTKIAILYFLLKLIKEDNPLKNKILKIINLIRFPLKFTTQ